MKYIYKLDKENLVYSKEKVNFLYKIKQSKIKIFIGFLFAIVLFILFYFNKLQTPTLYNLYNKEQQLISKITDVNKEFDSVLSFLSEVQDRDDNFYRVVSKSKPIPKQIREQGFGGVNSYEHLENLKSSELVIESNKKSDVLIKQLHFQKKSLEELYLSVSTINDSILSMPGIIPVNPELYKYISSPFGYRSDPMSGKRKLHAGLDFAAPIGIPIYSTGNGVVVVTRQSRTGYGNCITIDHGFGYKTIYAHLNEILVAEGDEIKRGQQIGTVGNTGKSTGPHLHYEVVVNNKKKDPKYFYINDLSADEYSLIVRD